MDCATGAVVDGATGGFVVTATGETDGMSVDFITGLIETGALVGQEETGTAEGEAVVALVGLQLPAQGRHCE